MKLIARTRVTIDVPFEFDVEEPRFIGNPPVFTDESHAVRLEEKAKHRKAVEDEQNSIEQQRIKATVYAEKAVVKALKETFKQEGTIVDILLEEVRQA